RKKINKRIVNTTKKVKADANHALGPKNVIIPTNSEPITNPKFRVIYNKLKKKEEAWVFIVVAIELIAVVTIPSPIP
ncbi:hypothetical protein QP231_27390, partial [Klebsiella pneumoniae]